jgi:SAM-dependent methyltransferase
LELGPGAGHLLDELRHLGWEVEGADTDPEAVRNATLKGLSVSLGSLEELRYPDDWFDAICMSHVVEHLHDPLLTIKECYRILKPGGRLTLITPNALSLGHRLFGSSWFPLEPPRHLHIFTRQNMRVLLQKAGFVDSTVFTTIRDADGLYVASRSIRRSGRFRMHSRQPRSEKILGRLFQVLEWALLKVLSDQGEELSAVARKQLGG